MLLRACLAPDPDVAYESFKVWRNDASIDSVDQDAYLLLPLLWRRMEALRIDDPVRATAKGLYRRTWYANQLALGDLSALIDQLAAAGVPAVVAGGLPLALRAYGDLGVRQMDDTIIAVQPAHAAAATDVVLSLGAVVRASSVGNARESRLPACGAADGGLRDRAPPKKGFIHTRQSHAFRMARGGEFELHWPIALEHGEADDSLWSTTQVERVHGADIRVLNPPDHLISLLAQGPLVRPLPVTRWAADAVTLIRSEGNTFDWNRLVERARYWQCSHLSANRLGYLSQFISVPASTLDALRQSPSTPRERRLVANGGSRKGLRDRIRELILMHRLHRTMSRGGTKVERVGIKSYMLHALDAPSFGAVLRSVILRTLRRARRAWVCLLPAGLQGFTGSNAGQIRRLR
jgi:hypothetical protein